jgi:diguanylate cyclase (GGDEF)-like protein
VQQIREKQQQIQQAQQELLYVAYHDGLTGLPNRAWFTKRLAQLIEQQQQESTHLYAVLFIDLDRFKLINDSLGHLVGDMLLRQVAQRLRDCLQLPNAVARLGGDEFAILLEALQDVAQATAIARHLQEQLRLPFYVEDLEIYSEASIGIAVSSLGREQYNRPEELLRDADVAMYCAKAEGKGRFEVFDPIMQIRAKEYLDLEIDLRRALDRNELSLHYQPIISADSGKLHSFETLVRWHHPTRGFISPSKFIPLAEETRLVVPLGWWVFEAACRQLRSWQQQFPRQQELQLNVNFSAIQLQQTNLVERIQQILSDTGLNGESLKLEITESYLLENISSQADTLQQLKALGIQLCIDDFGIGYSSLSRLHEFPIDILKIDRSFIQRVDIRSGANLETVRMIVMLAHSLGMAVVAEGVETREQLAKLRELGCNFVQGFLFSQAVDSSSASQFLLEHESFDWSI